MTASPESSNPSLSTVIVAGGAAGTAVDVLLFPLDTIKTRLQSRVGFWSSGGFRGLYSGLLSVSVGSAPSSALFFMIYETTKRCLWQEDLSVFDGHTKLATVHHIVAAAVGDFFSCMVRVPVEVVKQRTQACTSGSSYKTLVQTYHTEGFKGLYKGYLSTVLREVPFSVIQFPLWEYLKFRCSERTGCHTSAWESALCAGVAGAVAGGLTTPIDVIKTRMMLSGPSACGAGSSIIPVLIQVIKERGVAGLFAGLIPRLGLMSLGGAIFLGVYDKGQKDVHWLGSHLNSPSQGLTETIV